MPVLVVDVGVLIWMMNSQLIMNGVPWLRFSVRSGSTHSSRTALLHLRFTTPHPTVPTFAHTPFYTDYLILPRSLGWTTARLFLRTHWFTVCTQLRFTDGYTHGYVTPHHNLRFWLLVGWFTHVWLFCTYVLRITVHGSGYNVLPTCRFSYPTLQLVATLHLCSVLHHLPAHTRAHSRFTLPHAAPHYTRSVYAPHTPRYSVAFFQFVGFVLHTRLRIRFWFWFTCHTLVAVRSLRTVAPVVVTVTYTGSGWLRLHTHACTRHTTVWLSFTRLHTRFWLDHTTVPGYRTRMHAHGSLLHRLRILPHTALHTYTLRLYTHILRWLRYTHAVTPHTHVHVHLPAQYTTHTFGLRWSPFTFTRLDVPRFCRYTGRLQLCYTHTFTHGYTWTFVVVWELDRTTLLGMIFCLYSGVLMALFIRAFGR